MRELACPMCGETEETRWTDPLAGGAVIECGCGARWRASRAFSEHLKDLAVLLVVYGRRKGGSGDAMGAAARAHDPRGGRTDGRMTGAR